MYGNSCNERADALHKVHAEPGAGEVAGGQRVARDADVQDTTAAPIHVAGATRGLEEQAPLSRSRARQLFPAPPFRVFLLTADATRFQIGGEQRRAAKVEGVAQQVGAVIKPMVLPLFILVHLDITILVTLLVRQAKGPALRPIRGWQRELVGKAHGGGREARI